MTSVVLFPLHFRVCPFLLNFMLCLRHTSDPREHFKYGCFSYKHKKASL